jgi:hypothetical protein
LAPLSELHTGRGTIKGRYRIYIVACVAIIGLLLAIAWGG